MWEDQWTQTSRDRTFQKEIQKWTRHNLLFVWFFKISTIARKATRTLVPGLHSPRGIGRQWSLEVAHSKGRSSKNVQSVSCLSVTWAWEHLGCPVYSLDTTSKCKALTDRFGVYCGKAGMWVCIFWVASTARLSSRGGQADHLESMIKPKHSEEGGLVEAATRVESHGSTSLCLSLIQRTIWVMRCVGVCPWWLRC